MLICATSLSHRKKKRRRNVFIPVKKGRALTLGRQPDAPQTYGSRCAPDRIFLKFLPAASSYIRRSSSRAKNKWRTLSSFRRHQPSAYLCVHVSSILMVHSRSDKPLSLQACRSTTCPPNPASSTATVEACTLRNFLPTVGGLLVLLGYEWHRSLNQSGPGKKNAAIRTKGAHRFLCFHHNTQPNLKPTWK